MQQQASFCHTQSLLHLSHGAAQRSWYTPATNLFIDFQGLMTSSQRWTCLQAYAVATLMSIC